MKRPLCFICFLFLIIFVMITQYAKNSTKQVQVEGELLFIGKVEEKQISTERTIIRLSQVAMYHENTSYETAFKQYQQSKESRIYSILSYHNQLEVDEIPNIGAIVCIRGTARLFSKATNYGAFDQLSYEQNQGYDFYITSAQILGQSSKYNVYLEFLHDVKLYLAHVLEVYLPPKEASIMKAMLLGEKQDLEEEIAYLYQRNGIIHILAISGLHIAMIGMGIYQVGKRVGLSIGQASLLTMMCLIQYVIMTGATPSAMRAVIMFGLYLFALYNRRSYDIVTAMCVAYVLLSLENPYAMYQVGCLLSFGAILAIGLLNPAISNLLPLPEQEKRSVKALFYQGIILSASIQIMTLPILIMSYYEYPITSIALNLMLVPTVGAVVFLGILLLFSGVMGGVLTSISHMFAMIIEVILQCYELICMLIVQIPGQMVPIAGITPMKTILYYGAIAIVIYWNSRERYVKHFKLILMIGAISMLVWSPNHNLVITMIDVGQGDGILIQTPNDKVYFIDGGSTSKKEVGAYEILPTLKYYGIRRIDGVFITHLDADHYNGICELLEMQVTKGDVAIEAIFFGSTVSTDRAEELYTLIEACQIPIYQVESGMQIRDGDVLFDILMPYNDYVAEDENQNSIVMRLSYGTFDMLLTGDMEAKGEEVLLEQMVEEVDYEVLKVGHHGSKNATSEELLDKIQVEVALLSYGQNNSYGHPHAEVLERLREANVAVYQTGQAGAIVIETDGSSYGVTTYMESEVSY